MQHSRLIGSGTLRRSAVLVVAVAIVLVGEKMSYGECGVVPSQSLLTRDSVPLQGLFRNTPNCYSIMIPAPYVGYADKGGHAISGFGILLPRDSRIETQSYIYVSGEPNSWDLDSAREAALMHLKWIRKESEHIDGSNVTSTYLENLPAVRLLVRYHCKKPDTLFVREIILALSPDLATLFEMSLYSNKTTYDQDHAVLQLLAENWKYEARSSPH